MTTEQSNQLQAIYDSVVSGITVVNCGSYTSSGTFSLSAFGLPSDVSSSNFRFFINASTGSKMGTATKVTDGYVYSRGYGNVSKGSISVSGDTVTFTLPGLSGGAYTGPSAASCSAAVGKYSATIPCTIYYISE